MRQCGANIMASAIMMEKELKSHCADCIVASYDMRYGIPIAAGCFQLLVAMKRCPRSRCRNFSRKHTRPSFSIFCVT